MPGLSDQDNNIKILIVDDDKVDRLKYQRLLMDAEHCTFDVREVDSAEKALEQIEALKPNCILLDYHLPGLSGLEFIALIDDEHPQYRNIPIVMLTGEQNSKIVSAAIQFQISDYLIKATVDKRVLERSIISSIRRSAIKRSLEEHQRQVEEQCKILQKENQQILEFIDNVSHELMTPVASINLFLQELMEKGKSYFQPGEVEYLSYISDNCHQLKTYVDDLLDESRLHNGKITLRLTKHSVSGLISKLQKEYEGKAVDKGIKLKVSVSDSTPEFKFDKDRVYQILSNLMSNAVKFTDKGQVNLSVFLHKDDPGYIYFKIEDTGCGIAEDKLPLIFNRLYQVHSGDYGGLGLGLTIVSQLVKLHGGKIKVNSKLNKGSAFIFKLPV